MAETAAPAVAPGPPRLGRRRKAVVWVLIVLASVLGLVTILTLWVNRQMLDNGTFRNSSAELIQDPEIRSALSVYLVNQLYTSVDVPGQLEKQLPKQVKPLAGPVSAALRQPAADAVDFLLSERRVQQIWVQNIGIAHQQLVNVLENKTGYGIKTGNGVVTVNLSELVTELGANLGLPASALAKIPPDAGTFTVMRSDQLAAAQKGVRVIRVASIWLVFVVLGLYALAVYLARGRRRATLRTVGWAFVFVGLVVLVVRRGAGNYAVDALTSPTYRGPVHDLWLIESSILGETGRSVILYGILIVLGAVLAGPTRPAVSVRLWLAPLLQQRPGVSWGILGFGYLLVVLWGPTYALRTGWGILLLGALLAAGFETFRRQSVREFPDAVLTSTEAAAAAAIHSLGARVAARRSSRRGHDDHRGAAAMPGSSTADELARLHDLHQAGALTDEEFTLAKQHALGR